MSVDIALERDTKFKLDRPKKYCVVFLNDDYTPMDFVIQVLMEIFHHDEMKALAITMSIHNTGKGVAGIYTHEIATQKATETVMIAKKFKHPLRAIVEPE